MTVDEILDELGPGWDLWYEEVSLSNWRSRSFRLRKLAASANLGDSLVAYEQKTAEGVVGLWFASPAQ